MRVEVSRVRRCHGGDQLFRGPRGGEEESAHVLFHPLSLSLPLSLPLPSPPSPSLRPSSIFLSPSSLVLLGRLTRHPPRRPVAKLGGQVGASQVSEEHTEEHT